MSISDKRESVKGTFDVIDSFAILRRNEFYLIGRLVEGAMQAGWYAHITLNGSFALTLKIERIEQVLMKAREEYSMLVVSAEEDVVNLLLGLNIGLEAVIISTEGEE
ncbi:hypothetical protein [Hymenobacter aerophilus]|uniref:hypothetical protein n=1 Tax=Hymenobacter aerophilus TaxID=119644 RepID=UPI00037D74F4|nr:hypothetical protein [Hymenobacter aerophilus]